MLLAIRQLPSGNSLRSICNADTAQNLQKKKGKVSLPLPNKESLSGRESSLRRTHMNTAALKAKRDFYQKTLKVQPRAQMYLSENLEMFLYCALCQERWSGGIRHPGG